MSFVVPEITTTRLKLRGWKPSDREKFAEMNRDPRVMKFFPKMLTRDESNEMVDNIERRFQEKKFGLWAAEIIGGAPFIGFIGLNYAQFPAPFTPCTEVGWRLSPEFGGQGYASEGGLASLRFAFETLGLPEVVAFTAVTNVPSQKVMQRIGMTYDPKDDFDHPMLPAHHPLKPHVLYRRRP